MLLCALAHTTTSTSAPYQTAVLVPATFGCCFGKHSFTSLQPFPLPYLCASYDCDTWPANHVCILALLAVYFREINHVVELLEEWAGVMDVCMLSCHL